MPGKDCLGRDHPTGGDSPNPNLSRSRREAAAIAAARAETTRLKNAALDDVLRAVIAMPWLSDEARAKIASLIGKGGGGCEP